MAGELTRLAEIPVTQLKGVGPKGAECLAKVDVETVLDLLTYYPRRYIDRTNQASIDELALGEEAMVLVSVVNVSSRQTRNRRRMVVVDVTDGTGKLRVTFFNQAWRERQLKPGMHAVLFGKLEVFSGRRGMTNPIVDLVGDKTGRIIPVYPQSEKAGVMSWDVAKWMAEVLASRRHLRRPGSCGDPAPVRAHRPHERVPRHPRARDDGGGVDGTEAPGVRRVAAGAAQARAAQEDSRGDDEGHRARRDRSAWSDASTNVCPFP